MWSEWQVGKTLILNFAKDSIDVVLYLKSECISEDICSVGSPRSCLYIGASCIFCYDTTSFVCLLGEVRVAAKGVEALEFLFREVRVMWVAWGGWKVAFWG